MPGPGAERERGPRAAPDHRGSAHSEWNPGTSTVRLAAGVGLWNATADNYLLPARASATQPVGAGRHGAAAFFDVGFRFNAQEPLPGTPGAGDDRLSGLVARVGPGAGARRAATSAPSSPKSTSPSSAKPTTTCPASRPACRRPASSTASSPRTSPTGRAPTTRPAAAAARRRASGDARSAAALRDLRAERHGAERRLGHDAAAALAVGQLQPVRRLQEPVAVRRPRRGLDRVHAVRARARRLVLRPRRRRHLRSVGRRGRPLPPESLLHGHRRLLDGRLWHVQVHQPVPRPVRQGPADRRPARPRHLGAAGRTAARAATSR